MNLHEYQAKALLKKYGMPVQEGVLATTPEEAVKAFEQIGGKFAVMKAQVHAGGRGKAGGVKVVKSATEAAEYAKSIIGTNLVTYQTDSHGQPVNSVLVAEDVYPVERELYLGAVVDRSSRRVTFMASTEGGVEIEKVAEETPEKIIKVEVDPLVGLLPFQAREVAFKLNLKDGQVNQFVKVMSAAYQAFIENDFALFEINPLSVRENGDILCVDAKVGIDSNALYRLPEIAALRDKSQENERELKASEFDLNYVALEGNIGCMVNGAGLAMATMDIIKLYGGQPVNSILVAEDVYPVERELYLGAVVDRSSRRVTFMASTEGGVEIEKVAEETPEKIIKVEVDPLVGLLPFQAREVAFKLNLKDGQVNQFVKVMSAAYQAFIENDFALFEINPLSVRENGDILCVDAKVGIDSNALYRLPEIAALRDKSQENERELKASEFDLNYVALEGNIGCMVNGAGLAMATMDIIKLYGGQPANFLDVGGGATKDRVIEAFKIILADTSVQGVLINIFGGIVRCDMIAEAIIAAVQEVNVTVPVVVRLEGNNAELGAKLLDESGLKLISANGLSDAAEKIVAAVKA